MEELLAILVIALTGLCLFMGRRIGTLERRKDRPREPHKDLVKELARRHNKVSNRTPIRVLNVLSQKGPMVYIYPDGSEYEEVGATFSGPPGWTEDMCYRSVIEYSFDLLLKEHQMGPDD